jgi:hypothetical protein
MIKIECFNIHRNSIEAKKSWREYHMGLCLNEIS